MTLDASGLLCLMWVDDFVKIAKRCRGLDDGVFYQYPRKHVGGLQMQSCMAIAERLENMYRQIDPGSRVSYNALVDKFTAAHEQWAAAGRGLL